MLKRLVVALFLTAALLAGLLAYAGAWWYARSPAAPARPTENAARAVGEAVKPHNGLRRHLARRMDREVASGLLRMLDGQTGSNTE